MNFLQTMLTKQQGTPPPPPPHFATGPEDLPLTQILRDGHYVVITPQLAARILKDCRYERQRNIRHLHRYVDEFTFRLNEGDVKRHTMRRLESFIDAIVGKRLTYAALIAKVGA